MALFETLIGRRMMLRSYDMLHLLQLTYNVQIIWMLHNV